VFLLAALAGALPATPSGALLATLVAALSATLPAAPPGVLPGPSYTIPLPRYQRGSREPRWSRCPSLSRPVEPGGV